MLNLLRNRGEPPGWVLEFSLPDMPRWTSATLCLALLALLAAPALPVASSKTVRKLPKKKASKPAAEAPRPPLPEELPPLAPTVTYSGGQLTIVAQNSTLQDILTAVRKATGAAVDAPAASAGIRVATRLGPGLPRDVLSDLLNGSHFDYILLSSPENPGGVLRLILSPRSGSGATTATAPASPPGALFSQPAHPVPGVRTLPPDTGEGESEAPEESVEPAQEAAPEPEPQAPPQPEIKTPQQIQEEFLRRQQEQRQQQPEQPPQ